MKKYNIIYADPAWDYKDKKNNDPAMGGITYKTTSLDDMKKFPVNEYADKDCALCMWVTMPMLREGLDLIEAWGFKYVTCLFTWVKTNPTSEIIETPVKGKKMPDVEIKGGIYSGMGHWVNGNAELCLFGKKGKPERMVKDVKQIQISPRRAHSQKPEHIRHEIVRLFGDRPRIELFARERSENWDVWGNEVDSDIIL